MKTTKHQNTSILPIISTPEELEQYRYERAVNNANKHMHRRPLEELNNSNLGKTLDVIDLTADVATLFPPAAPIAGGVGIITGMPQAIAGGQE